MSSPSDEEDPLVLISRSDGSSVANYGQHAVASSSRQPQNPDDALTSALVTPVHSRPTSKEPAASPSPYATPLSPPFELSTTPYEASLARAMSDISVSLKSLHSRSDPRAQTSLDKILPLTPAYRPSEKPWLFVENLTLTLSPFQLTPAAWGAVLSYALREAIPERRTFERKISLLSSPSSDMINESFISVLSREGWKGRLRAETALSCPAPGETFRAFADRFQVCAKYAGFADADPDLVHTFILSLSGQLSSLARSASRNITPLTLSRLVDYLEQDLMDQVLVPALADPSPSASSLNRITDATPAPSGSDPRQCFYCKQPGHLINDCSKRPPCPRCSKIGHSLKKCPVKTEQNYFSLDLFHIQGSEFPFDQPPRVQVENKFVAILDSGAQPEAVCSEELALDLLREVPTLSKITLALPIQLGSAFLSSQARISEVLKGSLRVEGVSLPISIGIVPGLCKELIFGVPFLKKLQPHLRHPLLFHDIRRISPHTHTPATPPERVAPQSMQEALSRFEKAFDQERANSLPPLRPGMDISIELLDSQYPIPDSKLYQLSDPELDELRRYLTSMQSKGFISPSKASSGAGVFFVKKKNGDLRLCVDYRLLNARTKRFSYPIPLIDQLFGLVRSRRPRHFSRIDLKSGFNLLRVDPSSVPLTAFKTAFGLFEFNVMPFGLANAPAFFQRFMTSIFADIVGQYVVVYMDDILIFSESPELHVAHVTEVLKRLVTNNLVANPDKCLFGVEEIDFLGCSISSQGISMEQLKLRTVQSWEVPRTKRALQRFLGFCNYYRRFFPNLASVTHSLYLAASGTGPLTLSESQVSDFQNTKRLFESNVLLRFPDFSKPLVIRGDASDKAIGISLSQLDPLLPEVPPQPIVFYSRKLRPAEVHLPVLEKELTCIVEAFKQWRHLLLSSPHEILVLTDHKNLQDFVTQRKLSQKLFRWQRLFADFNFRVAHVPAAVVLPEDALSRREEFSPDRPWPPLASLFEVLHHSPSNHGFVLKPNLTALFLSGSDLVTRIKLAQASATTPILSCLTRNAEGLLCKQDKVYVPSSDLQEEVLRLRHDAPAAGHYGVARTLWKIKRDFYWPGMLKSVTDYVKSCSSCQRHKKRRAKPKGFLQPIPATTLPWKSISMDFITGLPQSASYNAILTVVDRFTKMAHFIPCHKKITALELAPLFIREIYRIHGVPQSIISDRDKLFISKFWRELSRLLGVSLDLSTARHPETDGQTERANQAIEQLLRLYCSHTRKDWADKLPIAEFAYNSTVNESTGAEPFRLVYGSLPTADFLLQPLPKPHNPQAELVLKEMQALHKFAANSIVRAQRRMKKAADSKRSQPPDYKVGDLVLLRAEGIRTNSDHPKFDAPFIGPFKIVKKIGTLAFRLSLPDSLRVHPVFHVSLLEPFVPRTNQPLPTPLAGFTPVLADPTAEMRPVALLKEKRRYGKQQFLVRFANATKENDSWVDEKDIPPHLVQVFRRSSLQESGPSLPTPTLPPVPSHSPVPPTSPPTSPAQPPLPDPVAPSPPPPIPTEPPDTQPSPPQEHLQKPDSPKKCRSTRPVRNIRPPARYRGS